MNDVHTGFDNSLRNSCRPSRQVISRKGEAGSFQSDPSSFLLFRQKGMEFSEQVSHASVRTTSLNEARLTSFSQSLGKKKLRETLIKHAVHSKRTTRVSSPSFSHFSVNETEAHSSHTCFAAQIPCRESLNLMFTTIPSGNECISVQQVLLQPQVYLLYSPIEICSPFGSKCFSHEKDIHSRISHSRERISFIHSQSWEQVSSSSPLSSFTPDEKSVNRETRIGRNEDSSLGKNKRVIRV
jgi:hypothetical protein